MPEGKHSILTFHLQFGLFHGDPHPGNIFALRDGRIAYVDFGNVAELSQRNKQTLINAVVHAVNEDYRGMADDFVQLVSVEAGGSTIATAVHSPRCSVTSFPSHATIWI